MPCCASLKKKREVRQLVAWIERKGGEITARQLQQKKIGSYRRSGEAEAALTELVSAKHGEWIDQQAGGCWAASQTRVFFGLPCLRLPPESREIRSNVDVDTVDIQEIPDELEGRMGGGVMMNEAELLLVDLTKKGIVVEPYQESLRFKPISKMTPELKSRLCQHKPAVLDLLRGSSESVNCLRYSKNPEVFRR